MRPASRTPTSTTYERVTAPEQSESATDTNKE